MKKRKQRKPKKLTLSKLKEYINDPVRKIKTASREFFMGTDIGTRRHKDKKKYKRKSKYKKNWNDEIQEG